ncbi:anti-sigma factor [Agrococcus sediminis]|uniref:Regulator of SigK n=1 Tax=Agrococcus sediminis TaxID=2599924 RepID=A0A5M8Q5U8_9MICO|nr:anti-sigma factor [Agrococcus sediminis]KAA6431275.1 anti-sigma factor [Agrococcus sediminis]
MSDDRRSVDDLAAAYALDALTPEERARFEAEASPEARAEAAALADTATLLGGDQAAPPPSLRASVLDAIAREPQLPATDDAPRAAAPLAARSDATGTDASGSGLGASAPAGGTGRRLGPAERRARARWQPMRVLGAVAASAALLVVGIAIGTQLGADPRQEALGAVVSASDAQRSEVELADGTVATVIWSAEQGQSAILFEGLGAAPEGRTYQAWYIDAAGPHDAGVFDAEGDSTAIVLEGELSAGAVVGVTVEPAGGSEAPTTDPILVVET